MSASEIIVKQVKSDAQQRPHKHMDEPPDELNVFSDDIAVLVRILFCRNTDVQS